MIASTYLISRREKGESDLPDHLFGAEGDSRVQLGHHVRVQLFYQLFVGKSFPIRMHVSLDAHMNGGSVVPN